MIHFFRQRAIFRASRAPLDPDEERIRFRRRLVLFAFLIALCLLAIPVIKAELPRYQSDLQARILVRELYAARLLAAESRMPVGFRAEEAGRWSIIQHTSQQNCEDSSPGAVLRTGVLQSSHLRSLYLAAGDQSGVGTPLGAFCFHPYKGVMVGNKALDQGWLYMIVVADGDFQQGRFDRARQVVLTNHGHELSIQAVSGKN